MIMTESKVRLYIIIYRRSQEVALDAIVHKRDRIMIMLD